MAMPLGGLFLSPIFAGFLSWVAAYTVLRVALATGFTIITFTGLSIVWDDFYTEIYSLLGSLGGSLVGLLEMMGIMFGIKLMISTIGSVVAIKALMAWRKAVFR